MTAVKRLSSVTGAASASRRTCVSRSYSRSTKVTASGVKRWCQPLAVISTSRRCAICVKPSKVISGSSSQPKMSVWAKSAQLRTRSRWMNPLSFANALASSSKICRTVSVSCVTLFMAPPSRFLQDVFLHDGTWSFLLPSLLNLMPMRATLKALPTTLHPPSPLRNPGPASQVDDSRAPSRGCPISVKLRRKKPRFPILFSSLDAYVAPLRMPFPRSLYTFE